MKPHLFAQKYLFLLLFISQIMAVTYCRAETTFASFACTDQEKWTFSANIPTKHREVFQALVTDKLNLPDSLMASSQITPGKAAASENKLLGDYFQARALFQNGLIHLSAENFKKILSNPPEVSTLGIQTSALGCLRSLGEKYPNLFLRVSDSTVISKLGTTMASAPSQIREDFHLSLFHFTQMLISMGASTEELKKTLELFRGDSLYAAASRALVSAQSEDYPGCVKGLLSLLGPQRTFPQGLARFQESLKITLGRCYHQAKKYDSASELFSELDRKSDRNAANLSELAWLYLMQKKYDKAVGTAMTLQSGTFRNSFVPESNLTLAISFHDVCQYQSALDAIKLFQKKYRTTFTWLKNWKKNPSSYNLYEKVIHYLESGKSDVPKAILNEWGISPIFLSTQSEINLVLDEQKIFTEEVGRVKARFAEEKEKYTRSTEEPSVKSRHRASLIRAQAFAKIIVQGAARAKTQASTYKKALVARVNTDLSQRNEKMLSRLRNMADKAFLIETEILQSASEDIVWQTANPQFKEFAKKSAEEKRATNSEVLVWGKVSKGFETKEELWEDEIGKLKVDVSDNCTSKEKFKAVKLSE